MATEFYKMPSMRSGCSIWRSTNPTTNPPISRMLVVHCGQATKETGL